MEKEFKATYIGDSKMYHRFVIDGAPELTGALFVPKDKPVPRTVTIHLSKTKQRSRVRFWN